ncbi:MAG: hypothetical protein JWN93_2652 [Hyphomicrobiales bacterium]|jgi:hypothetical protein|nr:hypothetical protein [Hyphomicrobiales bacterium]
MDAWFDFQQWADCARMSRPGHVFEVENAQGQRLLTPCVPRLETPWDWASGPVRFRLVREAPPRRSSPMPEPSRR